MSDVIIRVVIPGEHFSLEITDRGDGELLFYMIDNKDNNEAYGGGSMDKNDFLEIIKKHFF